VATGEFAVRGFGVVTRDINIQNIKKFEPKVNIKMAKLTGSKLVFAV
jgi:hypothetical protein